VVDEKDFQILSHLARNPFVSNEKVGRELGLSGNSIKRRIDGLVAEGVVPSTWLLPIPQVFRRHSRIFVYQDVARPAEAIQAAVETDPVVWAGVDLDRSFHVHAYAELPEAAAPERLVKLLGEPAFAVSPPFFRPTPEEAALSSLDLRILLVLVRRPRAPLKEIATATGLAPKTVRRRRDAMFANGLFLLFPVIHVAQSRGLVLYNAYVHGPKIPSNAQGILSSTPRCRLVTTRTDPPGVWLICWAESIAEVSAVEGHLRNLPGVERAGIVMRLRVDFAVERVEGWIRDELAKWGKSGRRDR
jgi:DNA-binding MarR family transcriptional regulator